MDYRKRFSPILSKTRLIILALLLSPPLAAGCGTIDISPLPSSPQSSGSNADIGIVQEVWDLIGEDYVDREHLDKDALRRAAIEGMLEELDDPYTSYLDVDDYHMSLSSLEGTFGGIGAYVDIRDDKLTIIAPIVGSPAERAGIKPGDVVLEVDGQPTSELSLMEAILLIRGEKGTAVSLLILHKAEAEPVEIEIIRDDIEIASAFFEMKEDIAYFAIHYFSDRTDEEMVELINQAREENPAGIILDLRSNPGGLLDTVVSVTSQFLGDGVVVYVVDNQGNRRSSPVEPGGLMPDLPMVVLTDNYSASGSEVLSGALQDHDRAVVAGAQTFGKGSVNTLNSLDDGSALYLTTARWLTPDGHLIEGKGITPDYEIDIDGDLPVEWALDYLRGNIPSTSSGR